VNLKDLCCQKLKEKGLAETRAYKRRLDFELDEIKSQGKESYFLGLIGRKAKSNKRNLMVPWLLSVVDDYDVDKWPETEWQGDLPDIDIDYIPQVREYLKNVWAPKEFGEDKVCNISTYTTFGLKSALLDMAKIYGQSRDELLTITKNLEEKDEDGRPLDWDASLRLNKNLQKYCEAHPEIAEAAKKLINRNRGKGVHAGGLIVSSKPLADFVPLVRDKDNPQAAAWPEGLSRTDLQPVGLVKFDFLVITNNLQVAWACELIKKRHHIDFIQAKPGLPNWSDLGYLNDSEAIALANKADLKCIFQFDGEGIQKLVAQGGVTSFHDLVAFTALYRPGPLGVGMAKTYVKRKKGEERYELHPLLVFILGKTYGVIVYQEQVMQILNVVGDIPLKDCEAIRKAISKKKIEVFAKYKEMFVANGQIKLGYTKEKIEDFWAQIESFSEYGFCKAHAVCYTYLSSRLLWLKAHYKPEFFCAILTFEKDTDKIKEYKIEAAIHKVFVKKADINKSGASFKLVGDDIYYGFSSIKGIGKERAEEIQNGQPYANFEDFLDRFGTDATVIKPLIGLRCFHDADPVTLWKFVDEYRDKLHKIEAAKVRYQATIDKHTIKLKELLIDHPELAEFTDDNLLAWQLKFDFDVKQEKHTTIEEEVLVDGVEVVMQKNVKEYVNFNLYTELSKLHSKWKKAFDNYISKNDFKHTLPKLKDFDADTVEISETMEAELKNIALCEEKYYGFEWTSRLENSPDFDPKLLFNQFNDDSIAVATVALEIKSVQKKQGKKATYYLVTAVDSNGKQGLINVWSDDMERWENEIKAGNILKMQLRPPSEGFSTYTFKSFPRHEKWKVPKDKKDDYRIMMMADGIKIEEQPMTEEEIVEQFKEI